MIISQSGLTRKEAEGWSLYCVTVFPLSFYGHLALSAAACRPIADDQILAGWV